MANKEVKTYEVKITREEHTTYIYHLKAGSKNEAKRMAISGDYEHSHYEPQPVRTLDVEVSEIK